MPASRPLEAKTLGGKFMIKRMAVLSVALVSTLAQAAPQTDLEKYLTITSVETRVETVTDKGTFVSVSEEPVESFVQDGLISQKANIGQVIQVTNELIALGERVYELVKKGKPVLNMEYAPISVLPKDGNGRAVEALETEGWSAPRSERVSMVYRNGFGASVVTFDYNVIFAYGGSYDGKGAYITAAQVIPSNVAVSWGFEFNAKMRLDGLQNHGTRANPVAGAVLGINYKASSLVKVIETNDSYHITGRGGLRKL